MSVIQTVVDDATAILNDILDKKVFGLVEEMSQIDLWHEATTELMEQLVSVKMSAQSHS